MAQTKPQKLFINKFIWLMIFQIKKFTAINAVILYLKLSVKCTLSLYILLVTKFR